MLKNRVAVVTNVRHFIGLPIAEQLARHGARVVCHDESFADRAVGDGFKADHASLMVSHERQAADVIENVTAQFGRVDILVNNDAFPAIRAAIEEVNPADLRAALDALVVGPFIATQAVAPQMKERRRGKIICVTSAAPFRGLPKYCPYVAARGGANALVVSLAKELAPFNIQVNAIAPNFVESPTYFPATLLADPESLRKITRNIPLGRLAKAEEIAPLAAFLASNGSDFITGHVLPVAGGWA